MCTTWSWVQILSSHTVSLMILSMHDVSVIMTSILQGYISPTLDLAFATSHWVCARMRSRRKSECGISPASSRSIFCVA